MPNTDTTGDATLTPRQFGPPGDYFIVEHNSRWAYAHADTFTAAARKLGECLFDDPIRFIQARLVHADKFTADIENSYLDTPLSEITSTHFYEMLEVLPPLAWTNHGGLERFNCREMTHGLITQQYARRGERCFSKMVRHSDPSTYITPALIDSALFGAVQ